MTRFEYLSVLISIVLALGISEVLFCWSRLIQRRSQVRFSWLHGYWSILIVFLIIQFWWGFWNFRTVENWSLAILMAIVVQGMTLVTCALLLVPGRVLSGETDLEKHYYDNTRPFFIFAVLLMIQFSVTDTLIRDTGLVSLDNIVRVIGACALGILAWSNNRRLHTLFPIIITVLLVIFLINDQVV